jgi:hypothetical protein
MAYSNITVETKEFRNHRNPESSARQSVNIGIREELDQFRHRSTEKQGDPGCHY